MKDKDYKKKIKDLILEENLLLPDFQRDFVWKPQEQQKKLVCSLFLNIPIGSILVLDKLDNIGLRKLCYKKEQGGLPSENYKLLMDGQQRISTIKSIFSNLYSNGNNWEEIHSSLHKNLQFRWFLDLSLKNLDESKLKQKLKMLYDFYWNNKFEDYDIEEMESFIINKKILIKNNKDRWHPSREIEKIINYCSEENHLPLFFILSNPENLIPIIKNISTKYVEFLIQYKQNNQVKEHCNDIKNNFQFRIENEKKTEIINKIETNIKHFFDNHISYKEIYGVEYEKSQLNKAIVAFNTMNTGGISLGVFDIVSAKYSKLKKGRLSERLFKHAEKTINKIKDKTVANLVKEKFIKDNKNLITKNFSDMYLNMLSLFINVANGTEFKLDMIKQQSLLKIEAKKIENNSEKAVESLILAFNFLINKCGVPSIKDIKYKLTVLPIAYTLYKYRDKKDIENKIEYSYWMSLFSGKYEKGQNAFSIDHLNNLVKFIENSNKNEFKKYQDDLCNNKGYSDLNGFEAFYKDNSYDYPSNIGEYFLQFILSQSYKKEIDIFQKEGHERIKIDHFENLHKDHIIPSSWIKNSASKKDNPVHSVLNKIYSPSKRNQERLNNSIDDEVTKDGMNVLCISTQLNYKKKEFNSEDKIKDIFLTKRFELFKKTIKEHLEELEKSWT